MLPLMLTSLRTLSDLGSVATTTGKFYVCYDMYVTRAHQLLLTENFHIRIADVLSRRIDLVVPHPDVIEVK
jgi:hypothetical protein